MCEGVGWQEGEPGARALRSPAPRDALETGGAGVGGCDTGSPRLRLGQVG